MNVNKRPTDRKSRRASKTLTVTERKRAEEALRESEEKYRAILESIEETYYEADTTGNLTFVNDQGSRLLGYSKDELRGMNNREYMDQENANKLYRACNKVYSTGEPTKGFDWEIIRKDGTKRNIEASISLIRNPSDQPIGFRGIVRDITGRKQTEEGLKESQKNLATILDSVDADIYIADMTNFQILFMNKHMQDHFGHDLIGKICWQVFRGESGPCAHCTNNKLFDPEGHPTGVIVWETKNPVTGCWYLNYDRAIRWVDGRLVRLQVATNITERKNAEEALRKSEERYRTILENIEDSYYEVDLAGNFTFFNDSTCLLYGYSKEELMGMNNRQYADEENAKKLYQAFNRVYRTGEPTKGFDWEIIRKDGTKRYIEASVSLMKNKLGQPVGFRGIVRDITSRKRTEEALRESEERYRTILENIEDGYYEVDLPGNFTFYNDSLCRMLGYSKDEMIGMGNQRYTDEENRKKLFQAFNRVYRTGEPVRGFDWEVFRKEGTKIYGEVSVSLIRDSNGKPIGFRGIARDITERKRTEEALRTEKQRFQTLSEQAPFGLAVIHKDGTYEYINPKFKELFGYDLSDIPDGRTWFRKAYPDPAYRHRAISDWMNDLESSMAGEIRPRVFTVNCEDGTEKTINFTPVQLETGEQLMACEDITERKRAEEEIKHALSLLNATLESTADGILVVDREGKIESFNRKFVQMWRIPESIIASQDDNQALAFVLDQLKDPESFFVKVRELYNQPAAESFDLLEFKDGRVFERYSQPQWIGKESVGRVWSFRDVSEGKRAEEALRKSELRFQELFNDAPVGYHEVNLEGNVIQVNRTELKMLGYDFEEMLSQPIWKFLDEEDKVRQAFLDKIGSIMPPGRAFERTYRRKDGTRLSVLSEDRILMDSDGKVIGMRSTIQDITELKRTEEEMAALQEQLRHAQKMEAVGQLAGGIAHDFNNLLTVIKGYGQLSLLHLKEGDLLWGNIQEIEKAAERAVNLTRQLLAFSRRQILDLKVLDLNTLLKDLDRMLRRIIGEDIELVTLLIGDIGRVKIDPGQIEQVILNLAVNARDAMPSGGKLTIETANVVLDEEYAHTHVGVIPGHYVRLSVSDTGFGMSPEVKGKVFEPFFTTKDKGKGTGLGLSTVYGIVNQSGGDIWLYSEPGHGTTFKIYLPRVEEELDTPHGRDETDSLPRGSETVLLVEDEPLVRDLAHRLLSQQGYNVIEAANGVQALRVAQEHAGEDIHLLLTDVVMPQMGGKELVNQLKILRPDVKVLYTSGYTDDAIVHHGVLEPGTNFLQKPFSPKTLSHKVREALDR